MKKWIAGLLAVFLLLTGSRGSAREEDGEEGLTDAEIQESVISLEGESVGTLAENLLLLTELLQDEDVRNLLQIQDVRDLLRDGVLEVLKWMIQNRPVTMKILTEMGVGERDQRCIAAIWDSAERIADAWNAFRETENGRQFLEEVEILKNDPDIVNATDSLLQIITSEDFLHILDSVDRVFQEEETRELPEDDDPLTHESTEQRMSRAASAGSLVLRLRTLLEESDWDHDTVSALLGNEDLWMAVLLLAEDDGLWEAVRKECGVLFRDQDIRDFVQEAVQAVLGLIHIQWAPDRSAPAEEYDSFSEEGAL